MIEVYGILGILQERASHPFLGGERMVVRKPFLKDVKCKDLPGKNSNYRRLI